MKFLRTTVVGFAACVLLGFCVTNAALAEDKDLVRGDGDMAVIGGLNVSAKDLAAIQRDAPAAHVEVTVFRVGLADKTDWTLDGLREHGEVVGSYEAYAQSGIPLFYDSVTNYPYFTKTSIEAAKDGGSDQIKSTVTFNYMPIGLKIKILPDVQKDVLNAILYMEDSKLIALHESCVACDTKVRAPETMMSNGDASVKIGYGKVLIWSGVRLDNARIVMAIRATKV